MERLKLVHSIIEKVYAEQSSKYFAYGMIAEAQKFKLGEDILPLAAFMNVDLSQSKNVSTISNEFGKELIEKIQLFDRISKISIPETQRRIADLRKIFIEITDDLRLIILKLIERLLSLKFASENNSKNIISLAEESLYLYAPIAHRLGISKLYQPLEDIAFKHLYPDDYRKIHRQIEVRRQTLERKLTTMSYQVADSLRKHNILAEIKHRVKRPYSIYRKLKNQNTTLDGIYDLMALRVITNTEEHCYLTLGIVHSQWIPIEKRFRDWITYPKPNGYRSIQTTVHTTSGDKFEIQIRTKEMDIEAEYGGAAHWAYKEKTAGKNDLWVKKLKDFLENDEYFENPAELFEMLKSEMKSDYIHVLTPKGNVISLVEGATALDFAFAVHTDIGYKAIGARINGKFAKLKTELHSGDVVDIITSNNSKPSRDWLDIVKSSRSRSKILKWFKLHERDLLISDGKKAWEQLKKQFKSKIRGFEDENTFRQNISELGYSSPDDFFLSIGNGTTKCSLNLLKKIFPKAFEKAKEKKQLTEREIKLKKLGPQIKVEGLTGIETKLAKCCYPIKGEPIVALVTKKSQIKIHRSECPVVKNLSEKSNLKKAEWSDDVALQTVQLKIFGPDYSNLLTTFVNEAADASIIVLNTEMQQIGKRGIALFAQLQVKDIEQLRKFTSKLRLLPGIEGIRTF